MAEFEDLKSHEEMWNLFIRLTVWSSIGITVLLLAVAVAFFVIHRQRPGYVFYDNEREWHSSEKPLHGNLYFQGWILGLLLAIGLFGFIIGIFLFIAAFLRLLAGTRWSRALGGALGAVAVMSLLGHVFVLEYPAGLLQSLVTMPWPLD